MFSKCQNKIKPETEIIIVLCMCILQSFAFCCLQKDIKNTISYSISTAPHTASCNISFRSKYSHCVFRVSEEAVDGDSDSVCDTNSSRVSFPMGRGFLVFSRALSLLSRACMIRRWLSDCLLYTHTVMKRPGIQHWRKMANT